MWRELPVDRRGLTMSRRVLRAGRRGRVRGLSTRERTRKADGAIGFVWRGFAFRPANDPGPRSMQHLKRKYVFVLNTQEVPLLVAKTYCGQAFRRQFRLQQRMQLKVHRV